MIMNSLYESGTAMLVDDHTDDIKLLREYVETLKSENKLLVKQSDDVQNKYSK